MQVTSDAGDGPRDCQWELDGLRLAGLAWGRRDGFPVLALHGWMDHAASFRELAPRLEGAHVVALDLSGHGLSGHRAPHATYNIWDDLPQIAALLDRLGWDDCILLGHSRGASIATLFAAAQPERVRALIAIESLVPEPVEAGSFVTTLRSFIEQTRRQRARPPRSFATRAEYVARRSDRGNSRRVAEALAPRALEESAEGVRLRGDPRLFASSAMKLTQGDVEAVLRSIRCPVLNVWGTEGIGQRRPRIEETARFAASVIPRYERVEIAGDHHLHLEAAAADQIARAIRDFLRRQAS